MRSCGGMADSEMAKFWDERAREDAYFFIDNRREYGSTELESFWAGGEADLDQVLEVCGAELQPDDVALDIGCGAGRLTRALAGRVNQVYGIDVSAEMLERAREHHAELTNITWLHGDGATLRPLAHGSIDAIVSHVVFQHIPDPAITYGYVREMGRVLRPGGWSAFQVSNDPAIHVSRGGMRSRLTAALGRGPGGQDDPSWLGSAIELDALHAAAHEGGLELERILGAGTQYCMILARRT